MASATSPSAAATFDRLYASTTGRTREERKAMEATAVEPSVSVEELQVTPQQARCIA
jgi:hypothetical protein